MFWIVFLWILQKHINIWVCLKIVYHYTQWLMIIIPTKWYNWGYTPFSDISTFIGHCKSPYFPWFPVEKPGATGARTRKAWSLGCAEPTPERPPKSMEKHEKNIGIWVFFRGITLWLFNIAMENHHFLWENSL